MTNPYKIESKAVAPFLKNGFLLACTQSKEATYIDPGDEWQHLMKWLSQSPFRLTSITLTHAHLDHISGVGAVKALHDVRVYLHPDDLFLYESLPQQAAAFGLNYDAPPPVNGELEEGRPHSVGNLSLEVLHTPGHSPGSVSLVNGDDVFCGDLVFAGSIGRTDLPGGSQQILLESVRDKILPLGDDKILHPGHGPDTTIGRERASNPFLTGL